MRSLSFIVPFGAALMLLGAAASPSGAERQPAPTHAISAAPGHAALTQNPAPADAPATGKEPPTFLRDVLPIFVEKCVRCHNNETKLMYNWLDYKTAYGDRWEIRRRVWDS